MPKRIVNHLSFVISVSLLAEFINKYAFDADKITVKKKDTSASDRVSAMLLGGSICAKESGKYQGPLFARKKPNYFGRFLFFMFVVGVTLGFWDRGRKKVVSVASSFLKSEKKSLHSARALASEGAAEEVEVEIPPPEERRSYQKNER